MHSAEQAWASMQQPNAVLQRNIRLLDLDQLDDWPGNLSETLATKGKLSDHKSQLQFFQWLFFTLYEKLDSIECHTVGLSVN